MDIWQILMTPFSWLLKLFCEFTNSYGVALILFTVIVKLILFPFSLKSKKSMIQMNILSGQLKEIQKRCGTDKERYNQEVQELYSKNNVNPMGGCLWSMLPLAILMPLYAIIRRPLKYMMGLSETATTAVATALGITDFVAGSGTGELTLASMINQNNVAAISATAGVSSLFVINFNFLGIDLAQIPNWKFWVDGITWGSVGLFLLPVISAGLSLFSTVVMNKTSAMNQQQEQTMASQNRMMLIMMPLMSLWIGFTLPAGMCVYWIANSVFTMLQEFVCGKMLKKDYEEARRKMEEAAAAEKAAEKERRRLAAERKAAALAEKKAGKKKNNAQGKKSDEDNGPAIDKSASRVGMRQYARGRAYDPNRYTVTEYRDPNVKNKPAEEELTELTEEEKALLAEQPATAQAAPAEVSAPIQPEEQEPVEGSEDYEPSYDQEPEEEPEKPKYEAPNYTKPDYDGDK